MPALTYSIFDNSTNPHAAREDFDFEDFREPLVSELDPTPENVKVVKDAVPGYSPALFKDDHRRKTSIESAQMLVYDIDEDVDGPELAARLRRRGISFVIHSTISGGFGLVETGRGRVRVILPLAKPVDSETFLRWWDEGKKTFHGYKIDESKKGAESLFFAPKVFKAHRSVYFFDCDKEAPRLGASGFAPFKASGGPEKWLSVIREADDKHTALNKSAFILGLMGLELEEVKTKCRQALKDNVVSEIVRDWHAADRTIEGAWTDGHAQYEYEQAKPKHIPDAVKATANRVLGSAVDAIHKGKNLQTNATRVGQFVPHVLTREDAYKELFHAWERAKSHDVKDREDAAKSVRDGIEAGMRSPLGLHDEWTKDLKFTADGLGYFPGHANVYTTFKKHPDMLGLLAYDVRVGAPIYLHEPPWHEGRKLSYPRRFEDDDKHDSCVWVRDALNIADFEPGGALSALVSAAKKNQYDALLDYYRALPSTNKVDVLETILCSTLGAADTAYVRAVTRKWLIGLVARQFEPGCKMDNVLITVGEQGLGKSTFFLEIFPAELQERVFTDSLNMLKLERDQIIKLSRFACVEISELAAMRKADIETVKMGISQRSGDERAAYAHVHASYPRRAVFCGTTNKREFLTDPSGNRRFWPVEVGARLDLERLRGLRNVLWGQAVSAYLRGEQWHLGVEEEALANDVRGDHEEEDPFMEQIVEVLREWPGDSKYDKTLRMHPWQLDGKRVLKVRVVQLMDKLGADAKERPIERRVLEVLQKLGWQAAREMHDGVKYRVWVAKRS